METCLLGKSKLSVSRLCFGSLTIGPLQANLPLEDGARVLAHAFSRGVNFVDTAQYYQNYAYIRRAAEIAGFYDYVISTKTYAYTRALAEEALEQARRELDRDVIDLFMLHEQESIHTLRGHTEALEYFLEQKEKGVIRAIGASMHHVAAVYGAAFHTFSGATLDVIHPIYNKRGLGIIRARQNDLPDGFLPPPADDSAISPATAEMRAAITFAAERGIGVFAMKSLGGGHLYEDAASAFRFVLDTPAVDAVAVGMQSVSEVDANVEFFENNAFPASYRPADGRQKRRLHIEDYCAGCGTCAARCAQKALTVRDGRAEVDDRRCVLCGYCAGVCPMFAIKVL